MVNQVILAGRLTHDPQMMETPKGSYCLIKIAVQRPFKNKDGQYDTDFFEVKSWNGNAQNVYECCKKGSVVVIFGRLVPNNYTNKENKKIYQIDIVSDRVVYMGKDKNTKDLGITDQDNNIEIEEED